MPKIRGIKPETWTDDKFVQLSPLARLLYIGMWNHACDNGHLEDNVVQLKMRILPADNCDVDKLLKEMEKAGRIVRKNGYIKVLRLSAHQSPDRRFITVCDWCFDDPDTAWDPRTKAPRSESTRSVPAGDTPCTPRAHADDGELKGTDGELKGAKTRQARKRATPRPSSWQPNDTHRRLASEYGIDIERERCQFADHHDAKGSKFKDWDAAFRTWLRNAGKFSRDKKQPKNATTDDGQKVRLGYEAPWMRRGLGQ